MSELTDEQIARLIIRAEREAEYCRADALHGLEAGNPEPHDQTAAALRELQERRALVPAEACPTCEQLRHTIVSMEKMSDCEIEAREAAEDKLYVPNQWVCRICGFCVTKMVLRADDGAVGIDTSEVHDICPNDGFSLRRLTWEQNATEAHDEWRKANERAEAAEAKLRALAPAPDAQAGHTVMWLRADRNICAVCGDGPWGIHRFQEPEHICGRADYDAARHICLLCESTAPPLACETGKETK